MQKNPAKGKLIVIEGADGSGKKTQADALITRLNAEGYKTAYYDFPQYEKSFFGAMVGRYLDGEFGEADDVSPYLVSVLYAGDRFEASKQMKADLAAGKIVITNRYIQSNMAHQNAKFKTETEKKKFITWLKDMEYGVFNIPRPDKVIYLYVPYSIGKDLVAKKVGRKYSTKTHDIHEKNDDFMLRSECEYLKLAKSQPEWAMIDCVTDGKIRSVEEIAEQVYDLVKNQLSQTQTK